MVVQHNLTAMNSNRMLGLTTNSQAKSTEKLSSGYKINRAADDAAGLSISEKMRKQIRGLTQAASNAQDGISSVQTAEGALTEVHDMLQRMNELAVKAANGTNSEDDRSYIQAEVDQLVIEIDRVATTTKFNETYLLKGTSSNNKVGELTYTEAHSSTGLDFDAATGEATIEGAAKTNGTATAVVTAVDLANKGEAASVSTASTYKHTEYTVGSNKYYLISDLTVGKGHKDADDDTVLGTTLEKLATALNEDTTVGNDANKFYFTSVDALQNAIKDDLNAAGAGDIKTIKVEGEKLIVAAFSDTNKAVDLDLHVGADATKDNKINLSIKMMSARGLGINGIKVDGDSGDNATNAINTINDAIQMVSEQRSALGAVQNRLEHTIANLNNVVENTTSAESQIRDTDMATEMVKYSNNNILAQAGQAMLAQANQSNQGVMSLLG